MAGIFDHKKIDKKWQKFWDGNKVYQAADFDKRPKSYILIEFPYPSGERLHVGHGRSYCALDAVARLKRMQGYNVLFPMGWDAFGLPAENYAIKTGIHPSITTKKNIENAKDQAQSWGLSFDWDREVNTTDPSYYKWTQWIFLQLFKKGLAYKAETVVNWCPKDKINLANEEVVGGCCERCGTLVERRKQSQWMLKITDYADRLLEDLNKLDYREDIKAQQINWIGKSEGAKIRFAIKNGKGKKIEVFTTRPDTLYGATFLVLSPEKAKEYLSLIPTKNKKEVAAYIEAALKKSELQRQEEIKEKTGAFMGFYAKNPATGEDLPVWVSDFVLIGYGTGAIMSVPAHDNRDFDFAKKFDLPMRQVIEDDAHEHFPGEAYVGDGKLMNSGEFNGLKSNEAIAKITGWLKEKGLGEPAVDYKLRDWVFSRQHYWGEPIPIIICPEHGFVAVAEDDLPVKLPYIEKYQPTETGESPLAGVKDWVEVKCPKCGKPARRETDTMPNWAGSSWYFLRYTDPKNDKEFADRKKLEYWMPVDWYNGGMEHTTLHLLYSRFWYKVLSDLKLVPGNEPYAKRTSHGVVLGPDGQKMSKSRGNVINPDEVVEEFGADTFRIYECFMGPFDQMIAWDPRGVLGVRRFLDKVWKAHQEVAKKAPKNSNKELQRKLHQLIQKVEGDTLTLKFNTAVASMMEFVNDLATGGYQLAKKDWKLFTKALAPYAPHLAEELWQALAPGESVHTQPWPKWDKKLATEETATIVVQLNGKFRAKIEVPVGTPEAEVTEKVQELEAVKPHLLGRKVAKTIFIPDNLINFVIK